MIQAADGKEAWRLIREQRPAVVILDWEMPVYKGLELTAVIKGDPLLREASQRSGMGFISSVRVGRRSRPMIA